MDRQSACVRLEFGDNRARLVTGASEPQHAGSCRNIERAVRALSYIVGAGERLADPPAMVKRLVGTERSIQGRNRMLLHIWEQDLMHVSQEMGEGGHRASFDRVACRPNRPRNRSKSDRRGRA
jgi:hypothetical protein